MNLLRDINPVTRILGLVLLTTPLMFTIDWVSATFVLAFTLLMVPVCGLGTAAFSSARCLSCSSRRWRASPWHSTARRAVRPTSSGG